MIAKIASQISLVMVVTCASILLKPQSTSAQINMSLLTEVASSCQKDTASSEYYKQMSFDDETVRSLTSSANSVERCIYSRYHYSTIQSKFPWLASTGEIIPGYLGAVAFSMITNTNSSMKNLLLDCIADKNLSSYECTFSIANFTNDRIPHGFASNYYYYDDYYIYVCPSCLIAHNNTLSAEKMRGSFIQWFLSLDKIQRRGVMSIMGDNNRFKISSEADRAVKEYRETIEKVAQQEKERRRREVLGN
jgi:hypothetical protein